jgi:hypothetical protein
MTFNFKDLLQFCYLFPRLLVGPGARRRGRGLAIVVAFYALYPIVELSTWMGFLLDRILFPGYRRQPVRSPVFIVGNPRSGTTFLHRLLARDTGSFTSMKMWEILAAPSIVQRRIVQALGALDRLLGGPVTKRIESVERTWQRENEMHRVGLTEPEEDDYLLLHIFSALTIWLSSGMVDRARPYTYFDSGLPASRRARIMSFYRQCLQRHLYAEGGDGRRYLAKNPALTPKLASLLEQFPDAKIIFLVRTPLEVVPSYVSMMQFSWRVLGVSEADDALRDYLLDMAEHWYTYPPTVLEQLPESQYAIVHYDDMIGDPERTVTEVYRRFGLPLSPAYAEILHKRAVKALSYHSRHSYSLEETGLVAEEIVERFAPVFERYGFATTVEEDSADSGAQQPQRAAIKDRERPAARPRWKARQTVRSGD